MVLRSLALASSIVVFAALPAAAQRDFSDVEIKSEGIRGGIHMLTGAGGNMGLSDTSALFGRGSPFMGDYSIRNRELRASSAYSEENPCERALIRAHGQSHLLAGRSIERGGEFSGLPYISLKSSIEVCVASYNAKMSCMMPALMERKDVETSKVLETSTMFHFTVRAS